MRMEIELLDAVEVSGIQSLVQFEDGVIAIGQVEIKNIGFREAAD